MNKTETLAIRKYLPPGLLAQFLKDWWQWQQEDEALANGPQVTASREPMSSTDLKATLLIGDEVLYLTATPADDNLPVQASWNGPYQGIVVGIGDYSVEVRKDGWGGSQPLYRVLYGHILQVNGRETKGDERA